MSLRRSTLAVRGLIPEQPYLPEENHPGIRGWLPLYRVAHAGTPLSLWPANVQGVPRRHQYRGGVRSASPEATTPPVFAYLLSTIAQRPKGGVAAVALMPQLQPPIGIYH